MLSYSENFSSSNQLNNSIEIATFAAGCFWCIESAFNAIAGVEKALSGYMGGHTSNPTYEDICTGQSGHAEVVQITFDNSVITYQELLTLFFALHDPTQLNRQGNDIGTQYRSAIFYHSKNQQVSANEMINELNKKGIWAETIVTTVVELAEFYVAEDYHQDYVSNNPQNRYCQLLVLPKLTKFKEKFANKLKV